MYCIPQLVMKLLTLLMLVVCWLQLSWMMAGLAANVIFTPYGEPIIPEEFVLIPFVIIAVAVTGITLYMVSTILWVACILLGSLHYKNRWVKRYQQFSIFGFSLWVRKQIFQERNRCNKICFIDYCNNIQLGFLQHKEFLYVICFHDDSQMSGRGFDLLWYICMQLGKFYKVWHQGYLYSICVMYNTSSDYYEVSAVMRLPNI